ncbi:MAG: MBL fold metallo-hydrolase, partial [Alistipes sp.]|nr:MBL fold metallo-hydrolase [Alistipes sp.]
MKIARLIFNPIQENTYIVWDSTLEAAIIDAGNMGERENAILDKFIADNGLKPVLAINTHGHFDHLMGVSHVCEKYGAKFALSSKDEFLLKNATTSAELFGVRAGDMPEVIDTDLDGAESIKFGETELKVIPTPG